jgi:hypothetical protein
MSMLVGGLAAKNLKRAKEIPELMEKRGGEGEDTPRRKLSYGEKIAEGVKRDLERLEREQAEKARESGTDSQ